MTHGRCERAAGDEISIVLAEISHRLVHAVAHGMPLVAVPAGDTTHTLIIHVVESAARDEIALKFQEHFDCAVEVAHGVPLIAIPASDAPSRFSTRFGEVAPDDEIALVYNCSLANGIDTITNGRPIRTIPNSNPTGR